MSIKNRITLAITSIVLLVTSILLYVSLNNSNTIISNAEEKELQGYFDIAQAQLDSTGQLAIGLATLISLNDDIQKDFAQGNRDALAKRTLPKFALMKSDFDARQFQFHKAPAYSFLRVHKPEKFGDDLSSFRKTVVDTNKKQAPIMGLEKGVAGIGIRGVVPMFYEGKHTGSVELGMSFGQPFFEQFKESYGVDIALYIEQDNKIQPFGSTLGKTVFGDSKLIADILDGKVRNSYYQTTINGTASAVYMRAVNDFSGNPIGVISITQDRTDNVKIANQVYKQFVIVGVVVLLLGAIGAYLISLTITNPITATANAMREIAQGDGDLTTRLPTNTSDELAALSKAFNLFSNRVHETVKIASDVSLQLADSSQALATTAVESDNSISQQQQETEQVATAMNEMLATVHEIAKNAEEASVAANNADQAASTGLSNVSQVVESIQNLARNIVNAESVIGKLESQSNDINNVLTVIRNIAEQTNLLALNAAIEAARAGEQGRGFAVVADEVRMLASKVQDSTQEIQVMIEGLQTGALDAVRAMHLSISGSEESVKVAEIAQESFQTIANSVGTINDMNMQISSAATEQVAVSDEINANILKINDLVSHSKNSGTQITKASEDLTQIAADMQETMGRFKL